MPTKTCRLRKALFQCRERSLRRLFRRPLDLAHPWIDHACLIFVLVLVLRPPPRQSAFRLRGRRARTSTILQTWERQPALCRRKYDSRFYSTSHRQRNLTLLQNRSYVITAPNLRRATVLWPGDGICLSPSGTDDCAAGRGIQCARSWLS